MSRSENRFSRRCSTVRSPSKYDANDDPSANGHHKRRIGRDHAVAPTPKLQLLHHQVVQEADDICAGADQVALVRKRALKRAGTSQLLAALEHEHRAPGPRQIGRRREPVVPAAHDDHVPATPRQLADRRRKPHPAQHRVDVDRVHRPQPIDVQASDPIVAATCEMGDDSAREQRSGSGRTSSPRPTSGEGGSVGGFDAPIPSLSWWRRPGSFASFCRATSAMATPCRPPGAPPRIDIGRLVSEAQPDRPSAMRELSLGALQAWQALSEAQGRGRGMVDVAVLFTDLVGFSTLGAGVGRRAGPGAGAPGRERRGRGDLGTRRHPRQAPRRRVDVRVSASPAPPSARL